MASIQLHGRDSLNAAVELVSNYSGMLGWDLSPDVPQACRIVDPFITTPQRLIDFICARYRGSRLEFTCREDVPPPDSAGGVVGIPIG